MKLNNGFSHGISVTGHNLIQVKNFLTCNPPYGKRRQLYILPQFLSNLTRQVTNKVIFWGGENRPRNSNIAYPRFEVYKTFLCVFMSNFVVFVC